MSGRFENLVNELTRRKVPKALLIYAMATWGVLQVVDVISEPLLFPDWIQRALVIATILGFPIIAVLSWMFDLTWSGLVDQEDIDANKRRQLGFMPLSVPTIAVLSVSVFLAYTWRDNTDFENVAFSVPSIAIMPLEGISDTLTPHLKRLPNELNGRLASNPSVVLATQDAIALVDPASTKPDQAGQLGVRYLLRGSIEDGATGINLSVSLFDDIQDAVVWDVQFQNAQVNLVNDMVISKLLTFLGLKTGEYSLQTTNANAYDLYLRGLELLATEQDGQAAVDAFEQAIAEDPGFSLPHASLCRHFVDQYNLYFSIEAFEQGEKSCFRALLLDDKSLSVHEAMGQLYLTYGEMGKARESFNHALAVNPAHFDAKLGLARTFLNDDPILVESILTELRRQQPGDPKVYRALQNLYFSLGRYDEAVKPARVHIQLEPNNEIAKFNLAGVLILAGEFAEAKDWLLGILQNDSPRTGSIQSHLATVYFFEGSYDEAATLYQRALDKDPENAEFARNLGDAIWHQNGQEAAQPVFQQVIDLGQRHLKINAEDDIVLSCIMVAQGSMGLSEEVEASLQRLLSLTDSDPQIYYDAAVAHARLGDKVKSASFAAKAIELGYPPALIKADPDISTSKLAALATASN